MRKNIGDSKIFSGAPFHSDKKMLLSTKAAEASEK
jgi:hypothetical protein